MVMPRSMCIIAEVTKESALKRKSLASSLLQPKGESLDRSDHWHWCTNPRVSRTISCLPFVQVTGLLLMLSMCQKFQNYYEEALRDVCSFVVDIYSGAMPKSEAACFHHHSSMHVMVLSHIPASRATRYRETGFSGLSQYICCTTPSSSFDSLSLCH